MSEDFFNNKWGIISIITLLLIVVLVFLFIPVQPVSLIDGIDYHNPETYGRILFTFIFIVFLPLIILYIFYMINKKIKMKNR